MTDASVSLVLSGKDVKKKCGKREERKSPEDMRDESSVLGQHCIPRLRVDWKAGDGEPFLTFWQGTNSPEKSGGRDHGCPFLLTGCGYDSHGFSPCSQTVPSAFSEFHQSTEIRSQ
jgi:hypothetical protein